MSESGQKAKYSPRADVFRSCAVIGHRFTVFRRTHEALPQSGVQYFSTHSSFDIGGPSFTTKTALLPLTDVAHLHAHLICPSGKSGELSWMLVRSPGLRLQKSHARKLKFAEAIQADLGRPVPLRKIFRFARRANHLYNFAPSRLDKRGVGHRHERWARDAVDAVATQDERRD
jgi:hypothetical protein